ATRERRRRAAAVRLALPVGRLGAAERGRAASPPGGAEPRRRRPPRPLVAIRRAAGPPLGGRDDRLVRPGVLRLLRRGRLLPAPARRRLVDAACAGRACGPPRPAGRG